MNQVVILCVTVFLIYSIHLVRQYVKRPYSGLRQHLVNYQMTTKLMVYLSSAVAGFYDHMSVVCKDHHVYGDIILVIS
jgi:hypothetical protein